jgi:hypothetical protein
VGIIQGLQKGGDLLLHGGKTRQRQEGPTAHARVMVLQGCTHLIQNQEGLIAKESESQFAHRSGALEQAALNQGVADALAPWGGDPAKRLHHRLTDRPARAGQSGEQSGEIVEGKWAKPAVNLRGTPSEGRS